MEKDFLICSIDQDVMKHGKKMAAALRKGKGGGIPWFVLFDPSEPVITKDAATGELTRRDAAVLATADGPGGNIGCPMAVEEREHFLACLTAGRKKLTDKQLLQIAEYQRQFSAGRNEKYGQKLKGMPKPQPTFVSLRSAFDSGADPAAAYFEKFRALAKNYLAKPSDRGRAALWCLTHFDESGKQWKKPETILHSLASGLAKDWANAPWAAGLADAIAGYHGKHGFDAAPVLHLLENTLKNPQAKTRTGHQRELIQAGQDS